MYRKSPYGPAKIMPVGPEIYPLNQCMHLYVNMYSRHSSPTFSYTTTVDYQLPLG